MSGFGDLSSVARQIVSLTQQAHRMMKAGNFVEGQRLLKAAQTLASQHPELLKGVNIAKAEAQMAEAGFEAAEREVVKDVAIQTERMVARQATTFLIRGVIFTATDLAVIAGAAIVILLVVGALIWAIGGKIGDLKRERDMRKNLQSMLNEKSYPKSRFLFQPGRVG